MKILFNPVFWIAILFIIRVENYPISNTHQDYNWRSSYTSMVSRNMLEISPNPFFPRIDHSESVEGIAACEFPIFNSLQFFCFKAFGYAKWYGRLINLIISSFGLYFFYRIANRVLKNDVIAIVAMLFLATSIWFNYSRRNMPDTFAVSLGLMAVEMGWRYLINGRWWLLVFFFLLSTAGLLSKMPAACNFPILLIPLFFIEKLPKSRKVLLFTFGVISVALMSVWYFWWVPYLETIGNKLTWPETFENGWRQIMFEFASKTWKQFWLIMFQGEFVFWLSVIGVAFAFVKRNWPLVSMIIGWASVSLIFMLKAGFVFSTHDYYTIPLAPVMAILAAYPFSVIEFSYKKYFAIGITLIVCYVSSSRQIKWYNQTNSYDLALNKLESLADKVIPKNARIVVNDMDFSPIMMFWSHRRGVILNDNRIKLPRWLSGKADQGATFAIINKRTLTDSLPFEVVLEDPDFRIYKLHKSDE